MCSDKKFLKLGMLFDLLIHVDVTALKYNMSKLPSEYSTSITSIS